MKTRKSTHVAQEKKTPTRWEARRRLYVTLFVLTLFNVFVGLGTRIGESVVNKGLLKEHSNLVIILHLFVIGKKY